MMQYTNKIIQGNAKEMLQQLPDKSVNCCITSPPYFGLRDYGTAKWEGGDPECKHFRTEKSLNTNTGTKNVLNGSGDAIYKDICRKCSAIRIDKQIGLEKTPELYVQSIVDVFEEVWRVLKDDGTVWLNLGDSYAGSGVNNGKTNPGLSAAAKRNDISKNSRPGTNILGYKPKDLIGIPWMVAFALRTNGWYLRQDIIWHKPNPMPESVTDRCTKSHEYIFLLSKSQKYFYDAEAIKEKSTTYENRPSGVVRNRIYEYDSKENNNPQAYMKNIKGNMSGDGVTRTTMGLNLKSQEEKTSENRNKRSVWTINNKPYKEAHFAVFPEKLIEPCIKAGCPEDGIVLDPFAGTNTTGITARKLNRNYISIELSKEYIDIAKKREYKELGMFL